MSLKLLSVLAMGAIAGVVIGSESAGAGASAAKPLDEVTVRAHRATAEQRARDFVSHVAPGENGGEGGLVRWSDAVCPSVSGVSPVAGEFILWRFTEAARMAKVPLAGEHCRPNVHILLTSHPVNLLKGMERRNRAFTFGNTPASVVDDFIATPQPVRVWYNSGELHTGAQASYLVFDVVWVFFSVFVIVDDSRLHGVTLGQLADYVAMVGLAKVRPSHATDDVPTILTLFKGKPESVAIGMTDWDRAFLKSMYATNPELKRQQGAVARRMAREIVTR